MDGQLNDRGSVTETVECLTVLCVSVRMWLQLWPAVTKITSYTYIFRVGDTFNSDCGGYYINESYICINFVIAFYLRVV